MICTILWPPPAKSWLIGKDSDARRGWGQEEKGTTEDEMAGWHHWLDGRESEWTPGVGDGQGGLVCCEHGVAKSWTRLSDWTELMYQFIDWLISLYPPPSMHCPLQKVLHLPRYFQLIKHLLNERSQRPGCEGTWCRLKGLDWFREQHFAPKSPSSWQERTEIDARRSGA